MIQVVIAVAIQGMQHISILFFFWHTSRNNCIYICFLSDLCLLCACFLDKISTIIYKRSLLNNIKQKANNLKSALIVVTAPALHLAMRTVIQHATIHARVHVILIATPAVTIHAMKTVLIIIHNVTTQTINSLLIGTIYYHQQLRPLLLNPLKFH